MSFGLLHSFFQPLPSSAAAAAAEAVPCELTVAPSGLAFCDKLVGTGPQAVKGQLIKVTIFILFFAYTPLLFGVNYHSWCLI